MGYLLKSVDSVVKIFKDGGRIGWLGVLGLFSGWIVWIGMIKGLAVMLPTLQEQFNASTWLVGWMIAITEASMEFSALFASPLRDKFGVRVVVTVSGVLIGGSLIASSFASSLYQIAILITLFAGPAVGVTSVVTREMIGRHFRESLTIALGLGGLGSSLAFVTMVPLTQFFLDAYGWRGTMLLLGAIFSHLGVCGALMKEPAVTRSYDEYQTVDVIEEPAVTGEGEADAPNSRCHSCLETVHSFFSKTFNISLLSSTSFWLICLMMNIWMIMYTAWFIYFVPNTISKGFSLKEASTCVVIYGIGRLPASVTIGPLVRNIPAINNSGWLGIGLVTQCIYYLLDPWLITYWPIFWAAFIYGYFSAMLLLLFDVIVIGIFGADQLGSVLGLIGPFAGLSRIFSLYFPGLIYDILGSYTLAFTVMGGVQCLSVVALLLLVWLQRRHPSGF